MIERITYNIIQVAVVLAFAPLVEGVTSRLKEILAIEARAEHHSTVS